MFFKAGYKPDSVEPHPRLLYNQLHPDDASAFKDAELQVVNGQHHDDLRFRIVNRGGERQLSISFHRLGSAGRQLVTGVVKDLTREEALHRKLADTAHEAGGTIEFIQGIIPTSLVSALTDGSVLQALFVALLVGFGIQGMGAGEQTHVGGEQASRSDAHGAGVQDGAVEVDEHALADVHVGAVVDADGGLDPGVGGEEVFVFLCCGGGWWEGGFVVDDS